MRIAILGTRGIPASYSGFETSVQETATRFVRNGVQTTVYCRSTHYRTRRKTFEGVDLAYLPSIKSKHLDTISNTFLSVIHALFNRFDVVILYGVGSSLFIPILRMAGLPVVSVVDGADWERKKWGRLAKWFLRASRTFAVRFSDYYVVDNELLAAKYGREFDRQPVYIPYGANRMSEYKAEILERFGLKERGYIIFVGRFVKEKGIEFLLRNFGKVKTDIKLVIVGDSEDDRVYADSLRQTKDPRVVFTGLLYGLEYESLLHKALFYVSCSLLEGTSPSLLSAMAINGFALVSDLDENKEVLRGSCAVFETGSDEDFREKLQYYLDNASVVDSRRESAMRVVAEHYDWDAIAGSYLELLRRCA